MSIETTMTRAWQRQAAWLWLLLPLSWLYGLIMMLRRQAYQTGLFKSYRAPIPVMVIGNITVGGSGKTPLIIALVSYLQQHGVKVGVISRGYGGDSSKMPALVTADSVPSEVGDEPCLIVNMTGAAMAVCPDRKQAITLLLDAYPDLQLIIADDGLQHYALQRDIEWIVVDTARGFGNQQLLPTGFLREPMSRLKNANVIYHEKTNSTVTPANQKYGHQYYHQYNDQSSNTRLTMQLQPDSLQLLWQPLFPNVQLNSTESADKSAPTKGSQVHAVSGIGYPQRFFDTLSTLGFDVIPHPYPDHYDFSLAELLQYTQQPIIVTSKDAVKIKTLIINELSLEAKTKQALNDDYKKLISRLWVLPVTAVLSDGCYHELHQQLTTLGIHIESDKESTISTP
ncbi:tetraacyldisaccharide 4'-kinase [Psychrobacter sp. LV10R520-6]|uniref:tetraacyldisaccharide 4'-kinase n=1 Tax=Psychrobacter sp. LV10R520-6 TaxID=1415574 RepID=UPI0024CCE84D|nr:tetraacyldisaccharide 4'-kinase [Psychrobacter sp. LV10R520-6]SNT69524.1 lipid-A-disaccharide kinase [Psychrobacter sp. LV10R520-6]